MSGKFAAIATILSVIVSHGSPCAEDWPGEAGKSEFVKGLPSRDFENARNSGMPLCIYFFDSNQRNNARARYLEQILSNAELRSRLKEVLYLKIRSDGSDVRGWPANLLDLANKSAAIVFISSDFKQIIPFDKSMQNEAITVETVTGALAGTLQYEKKTAALNADRAKLNGGAASSARKEDREPQSPKAIESTKVPGLGDKKAATTTTTRRKPTPADE
jgi:hypothetical protein